MATRLRTRAASESGFTLVELLVAMLILGLLASIALPAFLNQRMKAQDAEAKQAARAAHTAIETYATHNKGSYTGATPAELRAIEATIPATGVTVTPTVTGKGYTIVSTSVSLSTFTIARSDTGAMSYPCTTGGVAGCPEKGAVDTWN